jgi:hypothetical protein
MVASGVFPAGAKYATAAECGLIDQANSPVASISFTPLGAIPVAHLVCIPAGGHASMPADGQGFSAHFTQVY